MSKIFKKEAQIEEVLPILEALGIEHTGEAVVKKFLKILKEKKDELVDPKAESGETQRRELFSDLANSFRSVGAPSELTDADSLLIYLKNNYPLFASQNSFPLLKAISGFLKNCQGIVGKDPELSEDVLNYTNTLISKGSFDNAIQQLQDLGTKAQDPLGDGYVVSVLKGNFALTSVFTMMESLLSTTDMKFDSKLFGDLSKINNLGIQVLGPASAELSRANILRTEIGRTNFDKMNQDKNYYDAMIPLRTEVQHMKQEVINFFGNFYGSEAFKSILNDPIIKLLVMGAGAGHSALDSLTNHKI